MASAGEGSSGRDGGGGGGVNGGRSGGAGGGQQAGQQQRIQFTIPLRNIQSGQGVAIRLVPGHAQQVQLCKT